MLRRKRPHLSKCDFLLWYRGVGVVAGSAIGQGDAALWFYESRYARNRFLPYWRITRSVFSCGKLWFTLHTQ
uniref:Secreted protein n=1 Tax=Steinernema glaseri TaxID=37863 RepID=A0A1I7YAE0_9BILA